MGPCRQHRGSAEGHRSWQGTEEAVATREHSWEDKIQQRIATGCSWGPDSRLPGSLFERFRFGGGAPSLEVLSALSFLQPLLFRSGWW